MALSSDTLLDRIYLKSQITRWRAVAIAMAVFAVIVLLGSYQESGGGGIRHNHIARITFDNIIDDNQEIYQLIDDVADNPNIKAVIVWIDTPGGSAVGGEEIYLRLKAMAQKKPVVAVMRSVAASAGYMIALSADQIFAREGTITGSIGVIIESAEVTDLAAKIGIKPIIVKSNDLKSTLSPFEKTTPESLQVVQMLINDFHSRFIDMVAASRKLPREEVVKLADGRVYSGKRALGFKLIDAIGGEEEAVSWLESKRNIPKGLEIIDEAVKPKLDFIERLAQSSIGKIFQNSRIRLDGMAAIWHPELN